MVSENTNSPSNSNTHLKKVIIDLCLIFVLRGKLISYCCKTKKAISLCLTTFKADFMFYIFSTEKMFYPL